MKKQQQQIQAPSFSLRKTESNEKDFMYVIPPGIKFNDIYMDIADIQRELGIGRRTIYNMRNEGNTLSLSPNLFSYSSINMRNGFYKIPIYMLGTDTPTQHSLSCISAPLRKS